MAAARGAGLTRDAHPGGWQWASIVFSLLLLGHYYKVVQIAGDLRDRCWRLQFVENVWRLYVMLNYARVCLCVTLSVCVIA